MKSIVGARAFFIVSVGVAASSSAFAAPAVKAIMRAWKSDAAEASRIANTGANFDEAAFRHILEGFLADSRGIEARLSGASPTTKDLKARFARFEADVGDALVASNQRSASKGNFAKIINDCKACHNVYAN